MRCRVHARWILRFLRAAVRCSPTLALNRCTCAVLTPPTHPAQVGAALPGRAAMIHASRNPEVSILAARLDDLHAIMLLERAGFAADEQWSERSWHGELLGEDGTILIARAHHRSA